MMVDEGSLMANGGWVDDDGQLMVGRWLVDG